MDWDELKIILEGIGLYNFDGYDHFFNWKNYENDDMVLEKRIHDAICKFYN